MISFKVIDLFNNVNRTGGKLELEAGYIGINNSFNKYNHKVNNASGITGLVRYQQDRGTIDPNCSINFSERSVQPVQTFSIASKQVCLHPGSRDDNRISALKLSYIFVGHIKLCGEFIGLSGYNGNPGTTTKVEIRNSSSSLWQGSINLNHNANIARFNIGEDVYGRGVFFFEVGPEGTHLYDTTGINLEIQLYP